jgi:hypothetical protein
MDCGVMDAKIAAASGWSVKTLINLAICDLRFMICDLVLKICDPYLNQSCRWQMSAQKKSRPEDGSVFLSDHLSSPGNHRPDPISILNIQSEIFNRKS